MDYEIKLLDGSDLTLADGLLHCFADAFEDPENYLKRKPDKEYMESLLNSDTFIAVVACAGNVVIGGLAAYELKKFEQKRSEVYIYDLAVSKEYRRQGIATSLIEYLKPIARARGAWVIYVQADQGDDPAILLYSSLGAREQVLHFDIPPTEQ